MGASWVKLHVVSLLLVVSSVVGCHKRDRQSEALEDPVATVPGAAPDKKDLIAEAREHLNAALTAKKQGECKRCMGEAGAAMASIAGNQSTEADAIREQANQLAQWASDQSSSENDNRLAIAREHVKSAVGAKDHGDVEGCRADAGKALAALANDNSPEAGAIRGQAESLASWASGIFDSIPDSTAGGSSPDKALESANGQLKSAIAAQQRGDAKKCLEAAGAALSALIDVESSDADVKRDQAESLAKWAASKLNRSAEQRPPRELIIIE